MSTKKIFTLFLVGLGIFVVFYLKNPSDKGSGILGFNRIYTAPDNDNIRVASATSTQILAAKEGRVYGAIVNDCNYDIYLGIGEAASKAEGIRLNKNGGSFEIDDSNAFGVAISGIASISDGTDYCNVTVVDKY